MSATLGVLPTRYGGVTFRSRLEARWAVVFDALGIRWLYEHEGYVGGWGKCYLPDFWLPEIEPPVRSPKWLDPDVVPPPDIGGIHAEVKGSSDQLARDLDKIEGAIDGKATPVAAGLLILGPIPSPLQAPLHSFVYWHKGVMVHPVEFRQGRIVLPATALEGVHCYAWGDVGASELLEPWPQYSSQLASYRRRVGNVFVRRAYDAGRSHRFGT